MQKSKKISFYVGDLEQVKAIHVLIPEFDADYIDTRYSQGGIANKQPYILVCQVDGDDAGYLIAYNRDESMYLWLNGTVPTYRKLGIFREMMKLLVQEARKRGYSIITVKSSEKFQPMLAALEAFGFVVTGRGEEVYLEKRLSASDRA